MMYRPPNEKRAAGTNGDAQIFAEHLQNDEPGYPSPTWRIDSASVEPGQISSRASGGGGWKT